MPDIFDSFMNRSMREWSGEISATTFTCETRHSLAVPSGYRMEVLDISWANTGDTLRQVAIGGS